MSMADVRATSVELPGRRDPRDDIAADFAAGNPVSCSP